MKNYKRMTWCILGIPYLIGRCSIKSTGANPICSTEKITSSHYNCHLQQVFNEYPKHCPRTWPSFVCKTLCWALVVNLNTYSKWNPHWPIGKKTHTQWKWTKITSTPSRVIAATSRAIDIVICEPPPYQFQVASQKGNHYCSYQFPIWNNPEIMTQL